MKTNKNQKIIYYDKQLIFQKSKRGWTVVIMPDNILIDNYEHGYPHIHPNRDEIKTNSMKEVLNIVKLHIEINKKVDFKKLKEELIK